MASRVALEVVEVAAWRCPQLGVVARLCSASRLGGRSEELGLWVAGWVALGVVGVAV